MSRSHGPSLYFASDKNIFDALNQHKVDAETITKLFERRNIIVSRLTRREELAAYFARLQHDYYDHQEIAARLGIAPRRERITSMDVSGVITTDNILDAAEALKVELEASGNVVHITRNDENVSLAIQYTVIDYKRAEFTQVQVRDGSVVFEKSIAGYTIRNTQNEYINGCREQILGAMDRSLPQPIERTVVSLFDVPLPYLRSKFFHLLANELPGFSRRDVTDIYVYKAKPEIQMTGNEAEGEPDPDFGSDTHVEKVTLHGNGVTRSDLLTRLDQDSYFTVKMGWTTAEILDSGNTYDIEALFSDARDCTGFSFILNGIYQKENGRTSIKRRPPSKFEIDKISRVIEDKSRALIAKIKQEYAAGRNK